MVMDELDSALAQQAPTKVPDDPSLFELPPLIIDGIPTPVEKMTQAQLRAFIPLMLKYSTGERNFFILGKTRKVDDIRQREKLENFRVRKENERIYKKILSFPPQTPPNLKF
jgi:hypothetical protein